MIDWIKDVLMRKVKGGNTDVVSKAINSFEKGDASDMTYAIERLMDEIEGKGKAEGKAESLINLIREKLGKGINLCNIADILELNEDYVKKIANLINEFPELSDKDIALKILH